MHFTSKISPVIYILVFIFVKLYHCNDVSNKTVMLNENGGINANSNISEITNLSEQTTTIQPQENGNVMQMCNQTFPTPKGTF